MELRQAVDWGRLFLSSKDEISASNQAGLPFNVCLISKELGRGCFANQTILVNTVILFTRPLASVLRDEFVRDHCSFCFCPVGLNTCCGVCDSCNFCSSCASRGAFEWHVLECGWMMKSPESTRQIGGVFPTEFLRFSFRYLATLDSPCSFQVAFSHKCVYLANKNLNIMNTKKPYLCSSIRGLMPHTSNMFVRIFNAYPMNEVEHLHSMLQLCLASQGIRFSEKGVICTVCSANIQCARHTRRQRMDSFSNRIILQPLLQTQHCGDCQSNWVLDRSHNTRPCFWG
eukprot:c10151_g1_i3.p1 GENE.c10151_g1_i3~~c10151_g1_i3.p1  ORF type:complete len:286 (+),score=17.77 c10151_g1_i3:33-890(+)